MSLSDKDIIFRDVWQCAYQRRYNAMVKGDWELYHREHETLLMCLGIAKWTTFDTERIDYATGKKRILAPMGESPWRKST